VDKTLKELMEGKTINHKSIAAKTNGNEYGYRKNIEVAGTMLKDLIIKTEAVVRGEREDAV